MDNEAIPQRAPPYVLPTLNADVDKHEGLGQKPFAYHPFGELWIAIPREIHLGGALTHYLSFWGGAAGAGFWKSANSGAISVMKGRQRSTITWICASSFRFCSAGRSLPGSAARSSSCSIFSQKLAPPNLVYCCILACAFSTICSTFPTSCSNFGASNPAESAVMPAIEPAIKPMTINALTAM